MRKFIRLELQLIYWVTHWISTIIDVSLFEKIFELFVVDSTRTRRDERVNSPGEQKSRTLGFFSAAGEKRYYHGLKRKSGSQGIA